MASGRALPNLALRDQARRLRRRQRPASPPLRASGPPTAAADPTDLMPGSAGGGAGPGLACPPRLGGGPHRPEDAVPAPPLRGPRPPALAPLAEAEWGNCWAPGLLGGPAAVAVTPLA